MSQHDYNIANAGGAAVRSDINAALGAILSQNSGATAPTTTAAYMLWNDTTTGRLKIRNAANTAWLDAGHGLDSSVVKRQSVQASTSGTTIQTLAIPAWVERITVQLSGVSTSGASPVGVQLGSSAGFVTTGYAGSVSDGAAPALFTAGFFDNSGNAASVRHFLYELRRLDSGGLSWVCALNGGFSNAAGSRFGAGSVTLPGALDRVRVLTSNGTDTFDAGSVVVSWE